MKKFGGPGPGPYEKNTGIGEIPAAGPCDVKGLIKPFWWIVDSHLSNWFCRYVPKF